MWYLAFFTGLVGSIHCVGMCGPLALTIPMSNRNGYRSITGILLYNFGRITTYGILGLVFSLAGSSLFIGSSQQRLSLVLGIGIIIWALINYFSNANLGSAISLKWFAAVKKPFREILHRKDLPAAGVLGILNGLLPCGLVYLALAQAIAVADPFKGVGIMMVFGLGTVPAMLAFPIFHAALPFTWRKFLVKALPFLAILVGLQLIVRGLDLGWAMLSPKLHEVGQFVTGCP